MDGEREREETDRWREGEKRQTDGEREREETDRQTDRETDRQTDNTKHSIRVCVQSQLIKCQALPVNKHLKGFTRCNGHKIFMKTTVKVNTVWLRITTSWGKPD